MNLLKRFVRNDNADFDESYDENELYVMPEDIQMPETTENSVSALENPARKDPEFRPVSEPQPGLDPTYNPFDNDGFQSVDSPFSNSFVPGASGSRKPADSFSGDGWDAAGATFDGDAGSGGSVYGVNTGHYVERREDYGRLFEDKLSPSRSVLTVGGKYIFTTVRSGLMAVHVNRAMERLLYDRFLEALSQNSHVTQTSLFPVTVQVGVENMCLFEEHAQMLSALGFDIAPFGNDTIIVNGVPEGYSAETGKVQSMVGDLLLVLSEDHSALHEMMTANMAARLARLGAFNSDSVTNPVEAQRLMDTLFACPNPEYTNAGKKIIHILSTEDIDKHF